MKNAYEKHLSKVLNTFDKLMNKFEYDRVVLYSGEHKVIHLDDNRYPYKVYINFKYFAPILNNPHSFIIYKSGQKPQLVLFQKVDYWDSQPRPIEGEWTKFFDIRYFHNLEDMKKVLPANLKQTCFLGEEIERFRMFCFKTLNDKNVLNYIHYHRCNKSEYEVNCMRQANKIAAKAHHVAQKAFLSGKSELQTHLAYLAAIDYRENEVPYENIVAFDESASILHYVDYKKEAFDAKSFLLDAGASHNGYHADITRTFVKPGHNDFEALITAVDESKLNIINKIKIGLNYEQLQEQMHLDASKILYEFGFMNISTDEIYEKGYSKIFSPAGIGHYIGLQVHDIGNFLFNEEGQTVKRSENHPYLRLTKNIEKGNVFTIEPGIYVINQLLKPHYGKKEFNWNIIEKFKSYGGARMEDSVYVKDEGVENLTNPFFK